ncbi:MAG: LytTR family transcriptional regulator DNA-binding domain-containing protein [Treponema sp.]|nr:LytTR family transcriptional regulator DNA-binding domain-containing protein [Treponema sp.]
MKITILEKEPGEEDEIIVKCGQLDEKLMRLINQFKACGKGKMNFYKDSKIVLVEPAEVLYFESVDDKVFAYTKDCVYETKAKLYQLEEELPASDFFRANKAVIVNLDKIDSLAPAFGGRFEATLENGYKVVVSRNYLNELKERLGL